MPYIGRSQSQRFVVVGQSKNLQKPLEYDVRPGRRADIAGIQAVSRASWHKAYKHIFSTESIDAFLASAYGRVSLRAAIGNRRASFLVAAREGRVLGFCQFGDRGGGPELFRLYVDPRWWSRGIGRRLLSHAEMQLTATGARRYFLTVHRQNERSIVFYAKQGFIHQAARDRGDEWYMTKVLSQPEA